MLHYCYLTTVLQVFNITLILRHFVLMQILFCPAVGIDQSHSRLRSGHVATTTILLTFSLKQDISVNPPPPQ